MAEFQCGCDFELDSPGLKGNLDEWVEYALRMKRLVEKYKYGMQTEVNILHDAMVLAWNYPSTYDSSDYGNSEAWIKALCEKVRESMRAIEGE